MVLGVRSCVIELLAVRHNIPDSDGRNRARLAAVPFVRPPISDRACTVETDHAAAFTLGMSLVTT